MNILVIGDGFDLAHGLSTNYNNFLQFIDTFRTIYDFDENKKDKATSNESFEKWLKSASEEFVNEFYLMTHKNL